MQDKKTWLTVSVLRFIPKRQSSVHCSVYNDAFPTAKLSEPIKIKFRDYVKPQVQQFVINQPLELVCEDRPGHDEYQWVINGNTVNTETNNTLKILQINESYDGSVIKCLAYNKKITTFTLVKSFLLRFVESRSELMRLEPMPEPEPVKSIVPVKSIRSNLEKKKSRPRKSVFTCVAEEPLKNEPKYIWVDGKLEKSSKAQR